MTEIKMNEKQIDALILDLLKKHSSKVVVNVDEFLDLLKHSLSLNTLEKKRVVDAVPTLSQFQWDELAKVFREEREKFKELAWKHPDDIKKLVAKQQTEWIDLWELYVIEEEKAKVQSKDEEKIDDIKKSLGI